jgi:cobaltochelatase CobS
MRKSTRREVSAIASNLIHGALNSPKLASQVSDAVSRQLQQGVPELESMIKARAQEACVGLLTPVIEVRLQGSPIARLDGESHAVLPDLLLALSARCHVLLVGSAGTGKSRLAKDAARALGRRFHALSLGPTTPMSKVFGYLDAGGTYRSTPFRAAFEHGGVMLLDELDNGHPGLLAELNQALSIGSCAFADSMVDAHPDFRVVATANTYGHGADRRYVARQSLDAATLDRFTVIDVPIDEDLETRLVLAAAPSRQQQALALLAEVRRLRAAAGAKDLPLVFSPRASIEGARLLEAGADVEQVMRWRVAPGLSAVHRKALGLPPAPDRARVAQQGR